MPPLHPSDPWAVSSYLVPSQVGGAEGGVQSSGGAGLVEWAVGLGARAPIQEANDWDGRELTPGVMAQARPQGGIPRSAAIPSVFEVDNLQDTWYVFGMIDSSCFTRSVSM